MTEITVVEAVEQPSAVVREQVPTDAMTGFFDRAFPALFAALQAQHIAPAGPPFAMYYGMPTDVADVAAGIPVAGPVEPVGQVRPDRLPGGRVYRATHAGPYDTLEATYHAIVARMAADGEVPADFMWEQYLTDPSAEPDPAKWRTEVSWPVRQEGASAAR